MSRETRWGLPPTPRTIGILQLAEDEARRLGHGYIGTEHILLAIVREGDGIAAGVLESFGVELEKVRQAVELIVGTRR